MLFLISQPDTLTVYDPRYRKLCQFFFKVRTPGLNPTWHPRRHRSSQCRSSTGTPYPLALSPNSMSTPFPRCTRRGNATLRVPCLVPGCKRWFGNKAGLTQHTNRFHPVFARPSFLHSNPNPSESAEQEDESRNETVPSTASGQHTTAPEDEGIQSRWHGPGRKLYRNYHPHMTGMFAIWIPFATIF